jgi:hypothetical protein
VSAPANYADGYDDYGYDERQEEVSASEHGRRRFFEIGGCHTPGAWGDDS